MTKYYDVVFLHPLTSLRKHLINSPYLLTHYPLLPMGLFSLAHMIKSEGYEVKIVNLGLEISLSPSFEIEDYVKSLSAKIYAIDLHWFYHSEGAIQLAEMCKKHHPDSLVILGGFTATWFYEEILKKYNFIDAILLGEAEQSILSLVKACLIDKDLSNVPGIAYRANDTVKHNAVAPPATLDNLNFTDLSTLENWENYLKIVPEGCNEDGSSLFWLTIARGCIYNCIYCGGSCSSYKLLTKREKPIFRDPKLVAEDIRRLHDLGVEKICFSHDPEIAGKNYWQKILYELAKDRVDMQAYLESSQLPSRDFLQRMKRAFNEVELAIYPLSPNEKVRMAAGKKFTNDQLFHTARICEELGITLNAYFTVGLPGENKNFYELFKKLVKKLLPFQSITIPPLSVYTLDPSSLMATTPEIYNLKIYLKNFEDYKNMCSSPYVIDRIGHETNTLTREQILELTNMANEHLIELFLRNGDRKGPF